MRKRAMLLASFLLLAMSLRSAGPSRTIDDFENGLSPHWEVKRFKGETDYRVVPEEGGGVLQATSRDAASGLVYRIDYDLADYPVLTWRWKVSSVLAKGDERRKEGDDYAARVYVIFPHWFPPKTRTLNYIWANRLPKGRHLPNAFYGNAVMVAVESGRENVGRWLEETRNVAEDYRRIFGGEPPRVGAIALMTDTDNTGEAVTAWYDDLRIEAPGARLPGPGL